MKNIKIFILRNEVSHLNFMVFLMGSGRLQVFYTNINAIVKAANILTKETHPRQKN